MLAYNVLLAADIVRKIDNVSQKDFRDFGEYLMSKLVVSFMVTCACVFLTFW